MAYYYSQGSCLGLSIISSQQLISLGTFPLTLVVLLTSVSTAFYGSIFADCSSTCLLNFFVDFMLFNLFSSNWILFSFETYFFFIGFALIGAYSSEISITSMGLLEFLNGNIYFTFADLSVELINFSKYGFVDWPLSNSLCYKLKQLFWCSMQMGLQRLLGPYRDGLGNAGAKGKGLNGGIFQGKKGEGGGRGNLLPNQQGKFILYNFVTQSIITN